MPDLVLLGLAAFGVSTVLAPMLHVVLSGIIVGYAEAEEGVAMLDPQIVYVLVGLVTGVLCAGGSGWWTWQSVGPGAVGGSVAFLVGIILNWVRLRLSPIAAQNP